MYPFKYSEDSEEAPPKLDQQQPIDLRRDVPQHGFQASHPSQPPPPPPRASTTNNNTVPVDVLGMMSSIIEQNNRLIGALTMQNHNQNSAVQHSYHVMPDLSKNIKDFDGEDNSEARVWFNSLVRTAQLHHWPPEFAFETARMHLVGPARSWYRSRHATVVDWPTFQQAFEKSFLYDDSLTTQWSRMKARVQQPKESIHVYFHEKVEFCRRLQLPFPELREQVIIGLAVDDLAKIMTSRHHEDEDDLYADLIRQDRFLSERKGTSFKPRYADQRSGSGATGLQQRWREPNQINRKTNSSTVSDTTPARFANSFKCYNCNGSGHVAKNCTQPRRQPGSCYSCGSSSHKINECPAKNKNNQPEKRNPSNNDTSTNVIHDQDKIVPPYLVQLSYKVKIDDSNTIDYCLCALIDSGSPISLIKSQFVPIDLLKPYVGNDRFTGINGSHLDIKGNFETDCCINNLNVELMFYVVDDNTMNYPVILGRDYMSNPHAKVDFSRNIDNETYRNEILQIDADAGPLDICDQLKVNPTIDSDVRQEFFNVFEKNYTTPNVLPDENLDFKMKIRLTNEQPITFRPRKLSYHDKKILQNILDDYLKKGIIRPSDSPFSSPIVLVPKKNGETRLCVDFRELNKVTIKENFPIPLIDDLLDCLKDKQYFSCFDLKNGFHHIPIESSSTKYTSFVTPLGQYEFLKMPFGLTNSPKIFQRYINRIFDPLIRENKILLYLDDILIATEDVSSHLKILEEILLTCRTHNLELRLDKCLFLYNAITYLGYCIDKNGIRPSSENVEAVFNYPTPKTSKEVHRFLGLASFFRRFVKNFAVITKPLYALIRKDVLFKFGEEETQSFEAVKKILTTYPVLAIYSPQAETHLYCDASSSGYGAILTQKQADGKFRPVFYFSKRTTPTESRYHSFELECLAVIYALKRFHIYLAGTKFTIFTDCDSFKLTLSKQNINPRISRWAMYLQNYTFEIEHRPGSKMTHVDALSRCHSVLILQDNTFEQNISIKQTQDATIKAILNELQQRESKHFELRDGLVYRKHNGKLMFYIPSSMEYNVMRTCHDDLGHVGIHKVIERIKQVYWFPKMYEKVREYIGNCLKCIAFSPITGKQEGFLHSIPKGDLPFIWLHLDHYGPLEKTGKGFKYLLTCVDGFTKFVRFYPCKTTKAEEVIRCLQDYFRSYSRPRKIITDRGTAFHCQEFMEFCHAETIDYIPVAVGTPRANGQAERFHEQLTPMLAKLAETSAKWDRVVRDVEFAMNNTISRSTGSTPCQLLFGTNQKGIITDELREFLENHLESQRDFINLRQSAARNILLSQQQNQQKYNERHKAPRIYNENDYVMIRNVDVSVGVNKKLIPKFKGPFRVKKVLEHDRYLVTDVEGFQLTQRPFTTVCGPDQMKPWCSS